jgi:hypothetical protein
MRLAVMDARLDDDTVLHGSSVGEMREWVNAAARRHTERLRFWAFPRNGGASPASVRPNLSLFFDCICLLIVREVFPDRLDGAGLLAGDPLSRGSITRGSCTKRIHMEKWRGRAGAKFLRARADD